MAITPMAKAIIQMGMAKAMTPMATTQLTIPMAIPMALETARLMAKEWQQQWYWHLHWQQQWLSFVHCILSTSFAGSHLVSTIAFAIAQVAGRLFFCPSRAGDSGKHSSHSDSQGYSGGNRKGYNK
jgi:hypothetical protein